MKTLSLQRPLIMMVVGLPGAGKSFFARQFAETFGTARVSADIVRGELFGQPQYTSDETEIVSRMVEYISTQLAKTGRSFIIDGCCNTKASRAAVEQLAKTNGYKTLVVWVQTAPASAQARSQRRNSKKIDDLYNPSISAAQFETMSQRFNPPLKEQYVVISGMHAYSTQARTVLKRLAAPHAEAVENADKPKVRQVAALNRGEAPKPSRPPRRGVVIR